MIAAVAALLAASAALLREIRAWLRWRGPAPILELTATKNQPMRVCKRKPTEIRLRWTNRAAAVAIWAGRVAKSG